MLRLHSISCDPVKGAETRMYIELIVTPLLKRKTTNLLLNIRLHFQCEFSRYCRYNVNTDCCEYGDNCRQESNNN